MNDFYNIRGVCINQMLYSNNLKSDNHTNGMYTPY